MVAHFFSVGKGIDNHRNYLFVLAKLRKQVMLISVSNVFETLPVRVFHSINCQNKSRRRR